MIKPKNLEFESIFYVPKLELKWTKFFNTLKIDYFHKPKSERLENNHNYFPDFYFPFMKLWCNIQESISKEEIDTLKIFVKKIEQNAIIIVGYPKNYKVHYFDKDANWHDELNDNNEILESQSNYNQNYKFALGRRGEDTLYLANEDYTNVFSIGDFGNEIDDGERYPLSESECIRLKNAINESMK